MALTVYGNEKGVPLNPHETMRMALISLILTIENIVIIFMVSRFMFWVKNVVKRNDQNAQLWGAIAKFKQKYTQYNTDKINDAQPGLRKIPKGGISFIDKKAIFDESEEGDLVVLDDLDARPRNLSRAKSDGMAIANDLDVHAQPGTDAAKCVNNVKNVLYIDDDDTFHTSTLKGMLMKKASHMESINDGELVITPRNYRHQSARHKPISDIFKKIDINRNKHNGEEYDNVGGGDKEVKYRVDI